MYGSLCVRENVNKANAIQLQAWTGREGSRS